LLVGLLWAGTALAEDPALRVIDECRARLDAGTDLGIERVSRRCPELLPAIEKAPWRNLLPSTFGQRKEEISAESLRVLAELVRHDADSGAQRATPDTKALAPILAELGEQRKPGVTRWERFKRWLQQKFEKRDRPDKAGWMEKLRRQLYTSEGVARLINYLGYAMLLALVVFVIWSELRALGLFGGVRRASRRREAAEWRRRLMLADVFEAPLAERPGMLLKLLGEALVRARRLPAADGLTATALVRRAQIELEADRSALARVAGAAEQVRYGSQSPGDDALEGAVTTARELLGKFSHAPGNKH
jgi:hypothetical protein